MGHEAWEILADIYASNDISNLMRIGELFGRARAAVDSVYQKFGQSTMGSRGRDYSGSSGSEIVKWIVARISKLEAWIAGKVGFIENGHDNLLLVIGRNGN